MQECDNYLLSQPISQIREYPETLTVDGVQYPAIRVAIDNCHNSKVSVRIPALSDCAIVLVGTAQSPDSVSINLYAEPGNILPTQEAGMCRVFMQNGTDEPVLIGLLTSTHVVIDRKYQGWMPQNNIPVPVNYLKFMLVRQEPLVPEHYQLVSCDRPWIPVARQPRNEAVSTQAQQVFTNMPDVHPNDMWYVEGYYGQLGHDYTTLENNLLLVDRMGSPNGDPLTLYVPLPEANPAEVEVGPFSILARNIYWGTHLEMEPAKRDSIGELSVLTHGARSWYWQWASSEYSTRVRTFRLQYPGTELTTEGNALKYRFGGLTNPIGSDTPCVLLLPFYTTGYKRIRVTVRNFTTPTNRSYRLEVGTITSEDYLNDTWQYTTIVNNGGPVELDIYPQHRHYLVFRMTALSSSIPWGSQFCISSVDLHIEEDHDGEWIPIDMASQYSGSEALDNRFFYDIPIENDVVSKVFFAWHDPEINTNFWLVGN